MEGKYENLREKTIFDFTDDPEALKHALNGELMSKSDYLKYVDKYGNILVLRRYAKYIKNNDLLAAIRAEMSRLRFGFD